MSDSTSPVYGLTPQGFVRMRLPEIRAQILADLEARAKVKFEAGPDTFVGLLIDTFAEREAAMWEVAESVYLAMYPNTAEGVSLDNAVSFAGVKRRFDTPTLVAAYLFGEPGTIIPAGAVARTAPQDGSLPRDFVLQSAVTINAGTAAQAVYQVLEAVAGQRYSITVDGVRYEAIAPPSGTPAGLASLLAAALAQANISATANGSQVTVTAPSGRTMALASSNGLRIAKLAGLGTFAATVPGPQPLGVGELDTIVTQVPGWASVTNPEEGVPGLNAETSSELRARYAHGVYRLGGATTQAIRANLIENVFGLTSVQVYENRQDSPDSQGRPGHSVEAVVEGGLDADIAQELYRVVAGGINTYGNTVVKVTDASGSQQSIWFTRPQPLFIWLQVDVTKYPEEQLPGDVTNQIQRRLAAAIDALPTGKDVILLRLAATLSDIPGIQKVTIRASGVPSANVIPTSPMYSANDVPISPRQRARSVASGIQVNIL